MKEKIYETYNGKESNPIIKEKLQKVQDFKENNQYM